MSKQRVAVVVVLDVEVGEHDHEADYIATKVLKSWLGNPSGATGEQGRWISSANGQVFEGTVEYVGSFESALGAGEIALFTRQKPEGEG